MEMAERKGLREAFPFNSLDYLTPTNRTIETQSKSPQLANQPKRILRSFADLAALYSEAGK